MPIKGNDIYIDIYKIKGENADQAEIAVRKDTKLLIIAIVLGKQLCENKGGRQLIKQLQPIAQNKQQTSNTNT